MAKKRTRTSSTTKRTPPSVPKSVKRCSDGYCTEFIEYTNGSHIKLLFKKTSAGYLVYRKSDDSNANWICMSSDISVAPSTRVLFENLSSLNKAIAATETWLGRKLPDIK